MQPSLDDVRYDLAMTRARMAATLEELDTRLDERKEAVQSRVDAVRERLDLRAIAEQHPWAVLGVAVALGFAVGSGGADRRAAAAAMDAARALPDAANSAGSAIAGKVRDLRGGDDDDAQLLADAAREDQPGLVDRIASSLGQALQLDRFVAELSEASRSFGGPPSEGAPPA